MSRRDPRERHRGLSHHTATVLELLLAPVTVAVPAGRDAVAPRAPRADARRARPTSMATARCGLPARTMGRALDEDPAFFAAALASGTALAGMIET